MRKKGYDVVIIDGLEYKECSECHEIKPLNYIYERGVKKGYREKCYDCRKEESKLRYSSLSDEKKLEKIQRDKKRYDEKRPEILEQKKEYGAKNKEKISKRNKQRRIDNKEKIAKSNKNWRENNKEYIRHSHRQYYHKTKTDQRKLVRSRLGSRLRQAFLYYSKNGKVMSSKKYGIDFDAIFKNIGDCPGDTKLYSLDHIIPMAKFDLDNQEHVKLSHVPENIQWMLMSENLDKRDHFTKQIFLSPVLINILKIIGRYEEACLECFGTTNHEIEKESQNAT